MVLSQKPKHGVENLLKDENRYMVDFVERNLSRTAEMFSYEGIPEEIPIFVYERMLQKSGWVCVFRHSEKMYVMPCAICGELDEYYQPKFVRVVNPYLDMKEGGFDKTFTIGEDCEIIRNDSGMQGLMPVFNKYGYMMRTAELTLDTLTYLSRIPFLITAKNLNQNDSAEKFLEKIKDGDYGVIAGNDFFESVKTDVTPKGDRQIADVVEMANYVRSTLFNEIGILADYNGMKKERTAGADTQFATPSLIPFVENMLNERRQGWERVNRLFGLNVAVDFNSVWQLNGAFLNSATGAYLAKGVTESVDEIDEKKDLEEIQNENKTDEGEAYGIASSDGTAEERTAEERSDEERTAEERSDEERREERRDEIKEEIKEEIQEEAQNDEKTDN